MPEHVGSWHVLAWIHLIRRDVFAARSAFERALALDRNFSETHGGLAVVAALQGHQEEAHASIKRALRLDRQAVSARYAEILLLQSHGQHDEARAMMEAFLARQAGVSGRRYRDLVDAHRRTLHAAGIDLDRDAAEVPVAVVHH
jgi:Tfp pilus assembly protein PilF